MGRISPGPTRWPPGAERRLVPAKSNLKPQTSCELALRAVKAARGRPGGGGGAPLAWVWGVWGRALSHPQPPLLLGVRPGPTTHWLWVRGVWVWGPATNPKARALASWLCALWGRQEGARGRAPLACGWGVRGRALSHPRPPVLWGVRPGPTTHWLWVRGLRAWGLVTNPTVCALASWLCALWGRHEVARGGRLLPVCGAFGVGRSPTPDRLSFGTCGRGPLPTGCGFRVRAWAPGCPCRFSRAAVRLVLCALPGCAAPGGWYGLAPVLVLWFWPAACLCGVPRGPALVRRAS